MTFPKPVALAALRLYSNLDAPVIANASEKKRSFDIGDGFLEHQDRIEKRDRTRPDHVGCLTLRLAVVEDVYRTLSREPLKTPEAQERYEEALSWVYEKSSSLPGFSLREICEVFDWDITAIQKHLAMAGGPRTRHSRRPTLF